MQYYVTTYAIPKSHECNKLHSNNHLFGLMIKLPLGAANVFTLKIDYTISACAQYYIRITMFLMFLYLKITNLFQRNHTGITGVHRAHTLSWQNRIWLFLKQFHSRIWEGNNCRRVEVMIWNLLRRTLLFDCKSTSK